MDILTFLIFCWSWWVDENKCYKTLGLPKMILFCIDVGIAKAGETTNCDFHTDHSNSSNNTSTNISSEFQYNLNDAAGSPELFGPDSPIKLSNHTDSPAKRGNRTSDEITIES